MRVRRLEPLKTLTIGLMLGLLAFPACGGAGRDEDVSALPTYPADWSTGDSFCAGVGVFGILVNIDHDGTVEAFLLDPDDRPAETPARLVWPNGYKVTLDAGGFAIVSSDGLVTIRDGDILRPDGVCVGPDEPGTAYLPEIGTIEPSNSR